jgi:hypothetical protein
MSNEGRPASEEGIALYDAIERAIANVQPAFGKIGARTHRRLRSPALDAADKILAVAIAGGDQPITAKKAGQLALARLGETVGSRPGRGLRLGCVNVSSSPWSLACSSIPSVAATSGMDESFTTAPNL